MTQAEGMPALSSSASPEGWGWSRLDASRPRRALEHLAHSEVTPVLVDLVRESDVPPDSRWTVARDIPIIVIDTLDACWAFERVLNKLHGFSRTVEEAKADLVEKLGGHLQMLSSLESPRMAPRLRLELEFLKLALRPAEPSGR